MRRVGPELYKLVSEVRHYDEADARNNAMQDLSEAPMTVAETLKTYINWVGRVMLGNGYDAEFLAQLQDQLGDELKETITASAKAAPSAPHAAGP